MNFFLLVLLCGSINLLLKIVFFDNTRSKFLRLFRDSEKNRSKYNHGQNICRFFHVLTPFPITTGELELDYYNQKVNLRVAERVIERLKT